MVSRFLESSRAQEVFLPLPSRVAHTTVRQVAGLGAGYAGHSPNANGILHREALHGHFEVVNHELITVHVSSRILLQNVEKLLRMKQGEEMGVSSFEAVVDVNGYDDQGQLALLLAAASGHTETCKLLLEYHADVNLRKQNTGLSALHFACQEGHTETAKLLVASGANVNGAAQILGEAGRIRGDLSTPLHSAVIAGQIEAVMELLEGMEYKGVRLKADPNSTDGAKQTPLHRAAHKGFSEIASILRSHGAGIDARDCNGETPVFHAVESRSVEMLALLLKSGADANAVSTYGQTPMRTCAGIVHYLKMLQVSGTRMTRAQQKEDQTVTLMMEVLSDYHGVLNPKDRFFDLGVPSYLAKQSKLHFECLANETQGFGFISDETAEEQRKHNQTRGFGWITDVEVNELLRREASARPRS